MKKLTHINLFSHAKALSAAVIVLSVAVTAADVGIRKYTGDLIDALTEDRISYFRWDVLCGVAILFVLLKFTLPYVKLCLTNRLQEVLYTVLEKKALCSKQSALDEVDLGKASTYFTSDIEGIIRYANRIIGAGISDAFTFPFSVTILSILNPWLGLAAVLSSVVPVVSMFFASRTLVSKSQKYQDAVGKINQKISSYFYNLEFIKANGMESALETENAGLLSDLLGAKRSLSRSEAILSFPMLFSAFLTTLSISALGGYLVLRGEMRVGELFTAITLVDYVVSPVMRFENTISQIRRAQSNFSRINSFLTLPEEARAIGYVYAGREKSACSISIIDLCFRYPNGKPVFCDANFVWKQGRLNVVVGENGAGKSTLLKLLSGVYVPQSGCIEVDGIENGDFRKQMVIDTQRTVLFPGSIISNLTLGNSVSRSEIESVCKSVGIDKEIKSLPNGYETRLGEDGAPLSGGQKRRLCIARALIRNAPIYIFDEPTIGIDPVHIHTIIETLQTLAAKKLVIVVTHEPIIIRAADTVTELEGCL